MKSPYIFPNHHLEAYGKNIASIPDRLELRFWLFMTTLSIPAKKVVSIQVVPPAFKKKENYKFMAWFWGLFLMAISTLQFIFHPCHGFLDHSGSWLMAQYIKEVGAQYCVLTSELGQTSVPSPSRVTAGL
jgi:hypothetical protein